MNIIEVIKATCHTDWQELLLECIQPYETSVNSLLQAELEGSFQVFPKINDIFKAFSTFNRDDLKVIILGQDAYHTKAKNGVALADGMCFSVPLECNKCPPSLATLFKELEHEYGKKRTQTDLIDWSCQGVLLLNCALTVREGKPGSHMKIWKPMTERIIKKIAAEKQGLVYILWGEFAKSYIDIGNIDINKNLVLASRHPSPLAVSKGPFIGNMHFTKANEYLVAKGLEPITWV